MSEWETFCDESYYHLWRIRRKNKEGFTNGFHVQNAKEAAAVIELLTRFELDLCEARTTIEDAKRALAANEHEGLLLAAQRVKEQHDQVQEAAVFFNEKAETMRLERDEAREALENYKASTIHSCNEECKRPMCVLRRQRREAREDAEHWKTEYLIVAARLCGEKHPRDNGIISEHEIIPKLERERNEAILVMRETRRRLDDAWLEIERLKNL